METGEPALFVQFSYPRIAFRMVKNGGVKTGTNHPPWRRCGYADQQRFFCHAG
jgi:hypothetical protein